MLNDATPGGGGAGSPKPEKYDATYWREACVEIIGSMQPFLDLADVIERRLINSKLWFCSRDADGKFEPGSIDMVAELAFSTLYGRAKEGIMRGIVGRERFAKFEKDKEAAPTRAEKIAIANNVATDAAKDLYNGEIPFAPKSEDLAEIFKVLKEALGLKGGPK